VLVSWDPAGPAGPPATPGWGRREGGGVRGGLTAMLQECRRGGPHPTRVSSVLARVSSVLKRVSSVLTRVSSVLTRVSSVLTRVSSVRMSKIVFLCTWGCV
jgi:hypothetical protein